ncbi:PREDICTED: lysine-rich coiled-coil protein 1 [Calidris pugnax]|uniref:lysine-rich coiled-coil protein 1 n=1 Tax=Calidris pugnax TaxID=198806 RepID=UPI00071D0847|nr:PREDICTED: lysine-rich coiled-coil protein 1 [Calidris pugnax]
MAAERGGKAAPPPPLTARRREDDILDEARRKDLFTDTFCKVCKAVLQFETQRVSHYKGKKHAQKVRHYIQMHGEKDERQEHCKQMKRDCVNFQMDGSGVVDKNNYCSLCNVSFTSPVVGLSHRLGKIHTKKVKQLSGDQAHVPAQRMQPVSALQKPVAEKPLLPSKAEESSSTSNIRLKLNDANKYCKLCCAPFNNPLMAHEHYNGKKHQRNEARKKILEELGDKAIPGEHSTNALGVGYYTCFVCNVIVTSIETYQAHVQGNKHRISLCRETVLANLMKKSKKRHGSFQDELTDYVKVWKARGLKPRRYFGKAEEEEFQDKNIEGESDFGEVISSNFKCEQGQHSSLFSSHTFLITTGENKLPSWPPASEQALEKTPNYGYNKGYCKEEQASEVEIDTVREKSFRLSAVELRDSYKPMLVETSTSSYRKEQKFQIKHFEVEKYIIEELKNEKEATKQKRKKNSEGADFGKENVKQKRIKFEINLENEKKSRPYKGKRLKENSTEKESKKHKKDKKKPQIDVKKEDELLWDESVLEY